MMQALSRTLQSKHELNRLCAEAVQQQIARGEAEATQLRNRRRQLVKQVFKRIPKASGMAPRRLLHAAALVLAMWGFAGLSLPQQAQAAPEFTHALLAGFDVGWNATPNFADIDGDGDLDAFVGENLGTIKFYRNIGSNIAPAFVADAAGNPLAGFDVGIWVAPSFADIDGDGDLDAFAGEGSGTVKFYRNTGNVTTPAFVADATGNPLAGVDVGDRATPSLVDIDGDGDLDVFIGERYGTVKFYRNTGSNTAPVFVADATGNPLAGFGVGLNAAPSFADIDGDRDLDVFIGERFGTVLFFENLDSITALVSSVLPASRSTEVGTTVTAFATIINTGPGSATGCSISPVTSVPADFLYQTTDPATNALTGTPNTPVDIAEGAAQAQSFVFAFTPTAPFPPTDVQLSFDCTNTNHATSVSGLNTLLLSASSTPVPDIIALATGTGIVDMPLSTGGIAAFAVATVNVGSTGTITASVDTGAAVLPVSISVCETNPATSVCINPTVPESTATTTIAGGATPTFAFFLTASGNIPFDPANNRAFVRFTDSGGTVRGSTSTALRSDVSSF